MIGMGEHTPLSQEWFNPPLRYRGHEIETRYSPTGDMFAGCQCGWRSRRKTRRPLKSWAAHVRRATSNQDRDPASSRQTVDPSRWSDACPACKGYPDQAHTCYLLASDPASEPKT